MILTDCPELRNIPWRCVVIDEAHRLKNRNCKLLEGLKMMDLVSVHNTDSHEPGVELLLPQCSCCSEFDTFEGCWQSLSNALMFLPEL